MKRYAQPYWKLVLIVLLLGTLACNLPGAGDGDDATETPVGSAAAGAPTISITSPGDGSEATVGAEVLVSSTATDSVGVTRIDLMVDGAVVRSDSPEEPEGLPTFQVLQSWTPSETGTYSVSVIAYNGAGLASAPAAINVTVNEPAPDATATSDVCRARINTDLNRRSGPSTAYPIQGVLPLGTEIDITGHNGDRSWWQVDGGGWVSAPYTTTLGNCDSVPTASYAPPPPTHTPTATETPTVTYTPTATYTLTPTMTATGPTPTPTYTATSINVDFVPAYAGNWMCAAIGRVSFKIENIGNATLESLKYEIQSPPGTYLNGASQNAPFGPVPPLPAATCAQAGSESLAAGDTAWIHTVATATGPGDPARAILTFCTENDQGGTCKTVTLDFSF